MSAIKVLEQFHYFNILADVDSVYGNWAVSTDGDVINCVYPYAIFHMHIEDMEDEGWIELLRSKVWFKQDCEEAFLMALSRARGLKSEL